MNEEAKHILIVEHTEDVRDVLVAMLESHGYHVTAADCGEAMHRLLVGAHGIDAVVLDATVRSETAVSLARQVKDLQLPLVMISGSPAAIEFADTNGLQLLSKPLRMEDLFVALARAFSSGEFGQRGA